MKDIVIETKKFVVEIKKASSDCWLKDEDRKTYGIEISRIIDIIFDCLIETSGGWVKDDPINLLLRKLIQKGLKKAPRYKSEKDLHQVICDFRRYDALSGSEKKVFDALSGLSSEYRWRLYLSLYDFIDHFLWM